MLFLLYKGLVKKDKYLSRELTHHRKANVGLFEGWTIIGSVSSDCDDLSIGGQLAVDDASDKVELVDWLGTSKNPKAWPHQV